MTQPLPLPRDRPGPIVGAAVLLSANWLILAVILMAGLERQERVSTLTTEVGDLDPDSMGGGVSSAGAVWLTLLLLSLAMLVAGVRRVLNGRQAGRIGLWMLAATVSLVPLWVVVVVLADQGAADATTVLFTLVAVGAAAVAAVLLALPSVSAHIRARDRH